MNLLRDLPAASADEIVERLAGAGPVRIERIVSHGQASPAGFWYDQDEAEFVLLLAGAARLSFADGEVLALKPGDWVDIAPHRRHRVDCTDPAGPTVWLAVLYTMGIAMRAAAPQPSIAAQWPSLPVKGRRET